MADNEKNSSGADFQGISAALNRIASRISDEHLIYFDWRSIALVIICALLFSINVALKTSGSSVAEWNTYVRGDTTRQQIIGQPRFIRFDEWGMHTPMIISQTLNGFKSDNPALGADRSALLMSLPVKTFPSIIRPQLWSYFIFPLETAYSFSWNYKVYGMFLGVWLLLMLLTRSNFWMSITGSLWLCYSSFTQWWYSTPEPEMILSVSLVFVCFIYLLYARKTWMILGAAAGLALYSVTFLLFFYPPHQIPLAYFMAFVLAGYLMSHHDKQAMQSQLMLRLAGVAVVLVLLGLSFSSFMSQAQDTIALMTQTEYPGNRVSAGGEISIAQYFAGFLDMFFSEKHFPLKWLNVCEASNYILLFPVVFLSMIIALARKQSIDKLQLMIALYLIFMSTWMLVGYPEIIAKLSLLNRVKENRAFIGIGFASISLVILFLTRGAASQHTSHPATPEPDSASQKPRKKKASAQNAASGSERSSLSILDSLQLGSSISIQSLAVMVLILIYGFAANASIDNFFNVGQLIIVALLFGMLTHLILVKQQKLFAWLIVAIVLVTNLMTNPIQFGLTPILDKELRGTIQSISQQDPQAKWLYYGSNIQANYLLACGAHVINGSKFAPDLEMMKIIDPSGANKAIYNRFAQFRVMPNDSAKDKNDVRFKLENVDGYTMFVNPSCDRLKKAGVKYIQSAILPPHQQMAYLQPLIEKQVDRAWFFMLRDSAEQVRANPLKSLSYLESPDRFKVGSVKIGTNNEHDAFIITGVAYDAQTNDIAGGVVLELNGNHFVAEYGLDNPNVSDPKYRPSAFRLVLPFAYTGRGHTEFRMHVLTKDKKSYGISAERIGVDID